MSIDAKADAAGGPAPPEPAPMASTPTTSTEVPRAPPAGRWAFPSWFLPSLALVSFVAYGIFVLAPIVILLQGGWAFAGDPSEYLLSAHRGFGSGPGELPYVFPALPTLYRPIDLFHVPVGQAWAVADLVSGVLLILVAVAFGVLGYALGRSRLAALASGAAAGTFPALIGEVGWGGQAQFVAIILGTLAVALLLTETVRLSAAQRWLVAGLLLGGAALAEPYAAACLVVFAGATLLFQGGRAGLRPRALVRFLPVLVPPAVAVVFVEWLAGPSSPQGLGPPVLLYAATTGGWGFLASAAGLGDLWSVVTYLVVLGVLVVAAFVPPGIDRRSAAVAAGAVVAFAGEAFVVTPATYWPRAETFLVVPLAVAIALLFARPRAVPIDASPASSTTPSLARPTRRRRARRWVRGATITVAVALVLVQVVAAYGAYPGDLQFNEFDAQTIGGLSWLRSGSGGVVVVAPEALTFPIAYATERPIYPAVQPFWFDTSEERSAAVFASTVVAGAAWIDSGPLEVVEGGPPGVPSTPSVFLYQSAYLVPVGTFVEEEGGSFGQTFAVRAASPAGVSPTLPASGASLSGEAQLPTYSVTTLSSVAANGSAVVNYSFRPVSSGPSSVAVGVAFPGVGLDAGAVPGAVASVEATFSVSGGTTVDLPLTVSAAANASVRVAPVVLGAEDGVPTLLWNVTPAGGGAFNVSIILGLPDLPATDPALVMEAAALAQHDVQWVVVDTATNASALPRFEQDALFSLVATSGPFDVFRVV